MTASELTEGSVYFKLTFLDEDMLIPSLEALVFTGRNLDAGESGQVYFQDFDSYRRGVTYHSACGDEQATFLKGSENELGAFFEYEQALDVLMACSLRRRQVRQ